MASVMKLAVRIASTGTPACAARRSQAPSRARATPGPSAPGWTASTRTAAQPPVTGVCAQVELVGQVTREDLGCELARVLGVRAEHDPADRFVVGGLRAAAEQHA